MVDMLEIYASWPKFDRLEHVKTVKGYEYYKCPFGCHNYAYINVGFAKTNLHPVVYCAHCDKHGWYLKAKMVLDTIESEERKFWALLDKFKDVKEMSAEEACIAWHSKGMPFEIAEEVATDKKRFKELVEEHRAKSGNSFSTVY